MSRIINNEIGKEYLFMGNEAIARGALEAGVNVVTSYPGTPASEITENLAEIAFSSNLYVEWSCNEKVALEVAAAASFSELRALCSMKQNGMYVASDFLMHLSYTGIRGGFVIVVSDDPGGLSSSNEGETRTLSKIFELPLLEPGNIQEAKDMTKYAFELSEKTKTAVVLRSVTRISHASGNVITGEIGTKRLNAHFTLNEDLEHTDFNALISPPATKSHKRHLEKLVTVKNLFEQCPFNYYIGPRNPELLIITSSACYLYSKEAVSLLSLNKKVGILKLGTTWPLPKDLIEKHLRETDNILIVEEVYPFLEENIKSLAYDLFVNIGHKQIHGKNDNLIPMVGELNPDLVAKALCSIFSINFEAFGINEKYKENFFSADFAEPPIRERVFCSGCPHRASFWSIHRALKTDNRKAFVCGDIGCYSMGRFGCGFNTIQTIHAMGSGAGLASGFGKLGQFNMSQPVLAVCGDSTFFHSVLPAIINAKHHKSNMTLVVLDNGGTAMTGFQSHPGLTKNAMNENVPSVEIENVCKGIGLPVETCDPFDLTKTENTILQLMKNSSGPNVLILRQECALSKWKKHKKTYKMKIDKNICIGAECGCNRFCTRVFRCPGLIWDKETNKAKIDEVMCTGCGVCTFICPQKAIKKEEVN